MDTQAIAYARAYLEELGADRAADAGRAFRARSAHIARVCMWVDRLLVQGGVEDECALHLAAALHDVGYAHAQDDTHGQESARVLRAYARDRDIPEATTERAAFLVVEHSNKERWLPDPQAPRDLVLLMEADLLDEEGAMGIAFDCMSAALLGAQGFEDAYARMLRYEPKRLERNRMVTPLARAYWADKQRVIQTFMEAFAFDLGMDGHEA